MKTKILGLLALGLLAGQAMVQSSDAAIIYQDLTPTGILPSPSGISRNFLSGSGPGNIAFEIQGYLSLDGVNCCTDTFSFFADSNLLFQGAFDLGGGGTDVVTVNTNGATYTAVSFGFFNGGLLTVSVPIVLGAGSHVITFDYSGAFQGLGDEGWGLNRVVVEGTPPRHVPEPASLALLGLGLAGLGLSRRRKAA